MVKRTERLKLLLAYDGRPFRGWQSQATGDGIQDHLERGGLDSSAFEKMFWPGHGTTKRSF